MKLRPIIAAAFALLFAPFVFAQTTFNVTVATKTAAHPSFGNGWPEGYVIDGIEGDELTLVRGETYVFQMNNVSAAHPFFITTSDAGGDAGASAWTDGVTGNGATGNGVLTFIVPPAAPSLLYYQCFNHTFMGWKLNIIDPVSVEDETPNASFDLSVAYPNPSAAAVTVGMTLHQAQTISIEVFDVTGRRVAVLHAGVLAAGNDHRFVLDDDALPGGVYLIRATAGEESVERRITLVR